MADFREFLRRLNKGLTDQNGEPIPTSDQTSPDISQGIEGPSLFDRTSDVLAQKAPEMEAPISEEQSLPPALKQSPIAEQPPEPSIPNTPTQQAQQIQVPSKDTDEQKFLDAQANAKAGRLANQLGRAGEIIGAGISRTKPVAQEIFNEQIKSAGQPVEDIQNLQKFQGQKLVQDEAKIKLKVSQNESDPNSDISKTSRSLYEKAMKRKLPESTSAADIKAAGFDSVINAMTKAEELKLIREQKLEQQKEKAELASDDKANKRFDQMNKLITADVASGRSAFGIAAKNLQSIQNAKQLLTGRDPNSLDPREVYETARILDRVLSQGSPTVRGSEKLTPETASSWMAKVMERATNERQGAGQGSFVRQFSKTFDREEDNANKQIASTQKKLLGSYDDLRQKYPERWNTIMMSSGIPTDASVEPAAAKPQTKQAIAIGPSEEKRMTKDGKVAIFDKNTKEFLRYE